MGTNNIIVREYLNSLKEDEELDRLLPLLLTLKGLRIIRTAKDAKGQNQQGKDIIAFGRDNDGIRKRFYFEVKGHSDKNIDEASISKTDGILDSLTSARFAKYEDPGIPGFNNSPVKVILVHNGVLKPAAKDVYNGVIDKLFGDGAQQFERWDIHTLTDEFGTYLFSEYLLTEEENIRLFKRTLVLMDVPDYGLEDFFRLIDNLLTKPLATTSRAFTKLFSSLNLLSYMIWHYAKENNNLLPSIKGTSYLVLQTWAWILRNNLSSKPSVIKVFKKLLTTHKGILDEYFEKTLQVAIIQNGLFSEPGGFFENVGYSLRCMDYISLLVYYFQLQQAGSSFDFKIDQEALAEMQVKQKKLLFEIIDNNDGTKRPLLDRHSRPILLVSLFVLQSHECTEIDRILLNNYLCGVLDGVALIELMRKRLPELHDNEEALIETAATGKRSYEYQDSGSMLLLIVIELLSILGNEGMYSQFRERFSQQVDLQTSYPNWQEDHLKLEVSYFQRNMNNEMIVESGVVLPESLADFVKQVGSKPQAEVLFRTDMVGLSFLRSLSVIFFHNDIFPNQWRSFMISN
ncbi:hypothetical protein ACTJJ0_31935 [Chitinophaga sp. 22321]|uniref:Restriction endonuclease n=1 Tax=Chitinophaga hostae TaxID=2831022 RepID=A0ABS5JA31_9BACT|nr:hypothetical protein [Chitinophaga hostae]MBS0032071.1 hypothetical protein [Chitinophaga hostae]